MTPKQARDFLRALNTPPVDEGTEWINASCPLAPWRHKGGTDKSPSFGVNLEGQGRVYCFSCQFAGSLTKLVMELRFNGADHLRLGDAMAIAVQAGQEAPLELHGSFEESYFKGPAPVVPFPEWFREMFPPAWWQKMQHPYLEERGVPQGFARIYDLRVDEDRQRVVFPIRAYDGTLAGLHGRTYVNATPPYYAYPYEGHTNRHVWLGEHTLDKDKPVVMVESVFDFAAVWEVYENVLSPLSASISAEALFRVKWCHDPILLFDSDKAGAMARTRVRGVCPAARDAYCPDDSDPGECDAELLHELLWPHLKGLLTS